LLFDTEKTVCVRIIREEFLPRAICVQRLGNCEILQLIPLIALCCVLQRNGKPSHPSLSFSIFEIKFKLPLTPRFVRSQVSANLMILDPLGHWFAQHRANVSNDYQTGFGLLRTIALATDRKRRHSPGWDAGHHRSAGSAPSKTGEKAHRPQLRKV
jgi:hypothetical protein